MVAREAAMLPLDTALTLMISMLAIGTLAGVLFRHKVLACVFFPIYLASAAVGPISIALWPARFWNWSFVATGDALQTALRIAVAFEIARKTFRPYPRGYARVQVALALVLVGMVPFVALLPREAGDAFELARTLERVSYGAGLLFLLYVGAVRYYGVPVDPFHRAIATGFGVVTVLVGCASLLWRFDPAFGLGRDMIVKSAYPCVLAWWLVSAWRRDDFKDLSPETLRRIHPWRVR